MFFIGQKVITKYGPGTIAGFERIVSLKSPVEYPREYLEGDRIAVTLENPQAWPAHSETSGPPYFVAGELGFKP